MSVDKLKNIIHEINDPKIYDNIITNNITHENFVKLELIKDKLCVFLNEYKYQHNNEYNGYNEYNQYNEYNDYIFIKEDELDEYEKVRDVKTNNNLSNYPIKNILNIFNKDQKNTNYENTDFMV